MVHKLAIVAVIGLCASAVCMGAAALPSAAVGVRKELTACDFSPRSAADLLGAAKPWPAAYATSRTLDWDGSESPVGLAVGRPCHPAIAGQRRPGACQPAIRRCWSAMSDVQRRPGRAGRFAAAAGAIGRESG